MIERGLGRVLAALVASGVVSACHSASSGALSPARVEPARASAPASKAEPHAEPPIDGNAQNFFDEPTLARLSSTERAAWQTYLAASERLRAADRAAMDAELRAEGRSEMLRAPYRKAFRVEPSMTEDWFRSDEGTRFADNLLTFQTPSGGWSKRVEIGNAPRQRGQSYYSENTGFHYIATIDNDSTTEELRFLAGAYAARAEPRYQAAFERGIEYLLHAQFPNGCFPQVYPLQGGYHDAATYNDNAIVNVLNLFGSIAAEKYAFVSAELRRRAAVSVERGIACIVASQVSVGGVRTVWAQQHHPLTLAPVPARSYELLGLCGRESAWVVDYLMSLPAPDAGVVEAVHSAADWFRTHEVRGYTYEHGELVKVEGAGPLWARLYEIGSDRPIVSNRDGIKRYDWNELTDRRHGYTWFSRDASSTLAKYAAWAQAHPRVAAKP